ncbi:hypothetical protein ABT340_23535 [Streptosporangium sp. NPDC000239]|uniref:hypothetical protein n=1 Tax=Streptosporangium sp. NPDC000239 TaxID=3154248 RepID=UPI003331DD55
MTLPTTAYGLPGSYGAAGLFGAPPRSRAVTWSDTANLCGMTPQDDTASSFGASPQDQTAIRSNTVSPNTDRGDAHEHAQPP